MCLPGCRLLPPPPCWPLPWLMRETDLYMHIDPKAAMVWNTWCHQHCPLPPGCRRWAGPGRGIQQMISECPAQRWAWPKQKIPIVSMWAKQPRNGMPVSSGHSRCRTREVVQVRDAMRGHVPAKQDLGRPRERRLCRPRSEMLGPLELLTAPISGPSIQGTQHHWVPVLLLQPFKMFSVTPATSE